MKKNDLPLHKIKLFTHEAIVHSQVASIEKLLNRKIEFEINLNVKGVRSNVQFSVTEQEIKQIKDYLGYTVFTKDGNHWIPEI